MGWGIWATLQYTHFRYIDMHPLFFYIFAQSFLCPEKLLLLPDWVMQGENPVKAGSGRAAVREDETGINQCVETEREYMCEGAGSRLIPEPEELWEISC